MENRKQHENDAQTLTDEQLRAEVAEAVDAWLKSKEERKPSEDNAEGTT